MFERFTPASHAGMARAEAERRALGHGHFAVGHLLLGLCQDDAGGIGAVLAGAGITTADVRAWLAAAGGSDSGGSDSGRATDGDRLVTAAVKQTLVRALREALGRHQEVIEPAHLMLALLTPAEDASADTEATDRVTDLLRERGVDPHVLHAAVAALAAPAGAGEGFPFLGAEFGTALPARRARRSWHALIIAVYVALSVVVGLVGGPDAWAVVVPLAVLMPAVGLVSLRHLAPIRMRRRLRRPDVEQVAAGGLASALAPAGLRDVAVALVSGRHRIDPKGNGGAFRFGASGIIVLRSTLRPAHPDLVRFITAHEAAHLVRDDSLNKALGRACLVGIATAAVAADPAALWLVIPAVVGLIADNWLMELDCDRIAARATGRAPADQFVAYLGRVDDALRRQGRRRWLRKVRSAITHPPTRLRRRAIRRALAAPAHTAPQLTSSTDDSGAA